MGQVYTYFGFELVSGSEREEIQKLDFADACLAKANTARDLGDFLGSLGWLEQSLLVRAEVLGTSIAVNYNHAYVANLIAIGETHLSLRRFDQALIYFMRTKAVLDPLVLLPETRHTSASMQYVNLTAGLALVLTAVSKNNHKATLELLENADPLRVAEQQLEQAVIRVVGLDGARAPLLVSLYHILARVYLMTNKRMAALRVMQRCLGLTLHISQTKKIFSFLSYTRNVLDTIKQLTLVERVVIKIQQWYRDKRAAAKAEELKQSLVDFHFTVTQHNDGGNAKLSSVIRRGSKNHASSIGDENHDNNTSQMKHSQQHRKLLFDKFKASFKAMGAGNNNSLNKQSINTNNRGSAHVFSNQADEEENNNGDEDENHHGNDAMVANFFAHSFGNIDEMMSGSNNNDKNNDDQDQLQQKREGGVQGASFNNNPGSPSAFQKRQSRHLSMMLQHQQTMSSDRSHLVSPVFMVKSNAVVVPPPSKRYDHLLLSTKNNENTESAQNAKSSKEVKPQWFGRSNNKNSENNIDSKDQNGGVVLKQQSTQNYAASVKVNPSTAVDKNTVVDTTSAATNNEKIFENIQRRQREQQQQLLAQKNLAASTSMTTQKQTTNLPHSTSSHVGVESPSQPQNDQPFSSDVIQNNSGGVDINMIENSSSKTNGLIPISKRTNTLGPHHLLPALIKLQNNPKQIGKQEDEEQENTNENKNSSHVAASRRHHYDDDDDVTGNDVSEDGKHNNNSNENREKPSASPAGNSTSNNNNNNHTTTSSQSHMSLPNESCSPSLQQQQNQNHSSRPNSAVAVVSTTANANNKQQTNVIVFSNNNNNSNINNNSQNGGLPPLSPARGSSANQKNGARPGSAAKLNPQGRQPSLPPEGTKHEFDS